MPLDIRPLTPDDLPDLSRFLTTGFRTPTDAVFAAPDVLRWKYFDPLGPDGEGVIRSEVACDEETGQIIGHVGICPVRFRGPGLPAEGISAMHGIDWLASEAGQGVGAKLLWHSHKRFEAAYLVVATDQARAVTGRCGYEVVRKVPVYRNILRARYRLQLPGLSPAARLVRTATDLGRRLARPPRRPRKAVELRPVEAFGEEVRPIVTAHESRAVFTSRHPELLNHLLRYPRGGVSGWHLIVDGCVRGFAVLSVVPREGEIREGRIVDVMIDADDPDLLHASIVGLTEELKRQGADVAIGLGSLPATARALEDSGYAPAYWFEFTLRDRKNQISIRSSFYVTPVEADFAYT
jgi:hypothetical protein